VKEYLYDNLNDEALAENPTAQQALSDIVGRLDVSDIKRGADSSAFEESVNGVKFTLRENNLGWKWIRLDFNGNGGSFTYENSRGEKTVTFGRNVYIDEVFPETNDYDVTVHTPSGRGLRCLVAGSWLEEKKFLLRVHFIDTNLGSMYVTVSFKGDEVGIFVRRFTEFFLKDYGEWDEYTAGVKA
jgi:hypothetical protein